MLRLALLLASCTAFGLQATLPRTSAVRTARRTSIAMPSLLLTSNVRLPADKSAAFLTAASSAVAAGLGKPESYVLTSLQYADQMSFGGTCGPTCFAYVASIGAINPDNNNKLCASLCALVEEHLGVAGDRTYIQFTDAERSNFGWQGKTF